MNRKTAAEREAEIEREQALLRDQIAISEKLIDQSRSLIERGGKRRGGKPEPSDPSS